jgi:hypothetical protein
MPSILNLKFKVRDVADDDGDDDHLLRSADRGCFAGQQIVRRVQ